MEQKKNHLSKILWRMILITAIAVLLCGSAIAMEGTGTEADPYVITTAEDLAAVHNDLDGHYVLGNDIDLSGYDHTPIGNEAEGAFTGSFDGEGFTLSNLTVKEATKYVGLFGYLEGTVKNVILDAVEIEGARYVGGVVGYATADTTITDCSVLSGSVTCSDPLINTYTGGVVGYCGSSLDGQFTNKASIVVEVSVSGAYTGGIVGFCVGDLNGVFINDADISVNYGKSVGGIVGECRNATFNNSTNSGTIVFTRASAYNANVGGLIGLCTDAKLTGCANEKPVMFSHINYYYTGTSYRNVGGIIGGCEKGELINCRNDGYISAEDSANYSKCRSGGMIGYVTDAIVENCINTGSISASSHNWKSSSGPCSAAGGMIGFAQKSEFLNCLNSGNISSVGECGSVVGLHQSYAGGILGRSEASVSLNCCTNNGNVYAATSSWDYNCAPGDLVGSYSYKLQLEGVNINRGDISGINASSIAHRSVGSAKVYASFGGTSLHISTQEISTYGNNLRYFCSDIGKYVETTTNIKTLAELKNLELYSTDDPVCNWIIDSNKNSGLPFPEDMRKDLFNESVLFLTPGDTARLEAEFAVDRWAITDDSIVSCENGVVKALKVGSAGVSAHAVNNENRANCIIFVYEPKDEMTITAAATALNKGETTQVTTDLYDENPDDPQGFVWSTSDPSIATIDATGKVTAVGGGQVTITGYAPLSDISASCTITVTAPITSLSVPSSVTINAGTPTKLSYTVSPNPFTGTLTWKSTDESIVTVEDGVLTGHKPGMCIVTAIADTGLERSCTVTVLQPSSGLSLSESEVTMEAGYTHELIATLIPENSTDAITWKSSNTSVATVSNGVLYAYNPGQTLITATTASGYKAYCTVTVVKATVLPASITLNQQSWRAKVGEKMQLTANVQPSNATDKTVTWSSSAPEIVSVSSTGVVTANASGQAVITATTHNGLFAECEVKVAVTSSAAFELGDGRATVGETVEIPVYIHRNPGIAAFTVTLDYDKAAMEPVAVTAGDLLSVGIFETNLSDENRSQLHLTWYDAENLTEDGLAFTITMQVADTASAGTYNVGLSYETDDICDADKSSVSFAIEPAKVSVVHYLIGDIYADGKVGMKDIVLLCRYINDMENLSGDQLLAADVYYDGNVDVKDLVQLAQILMNRAPVTAQTFGLRTFGAEESSLSGKIKIEASEPDHNGNVKITVSVKESADIAAFRFGLGALTEYLEINNIVQGADLTEGTFQYQCNADGVPVVLWYDSVSHSVDGEIFVIHATVRDGTEFGDYAIDLNWDADDICNEAFSNITMTADAAEVDFAPNLLISDAAMTVEEKNVSIQVDFTSNARSSYSATAVLGFYNDGKMVKTQIVSVEIHGDQAEVNVSADFAFTQCKLFILEDMTTWSPTANAVTIDR